MDKAAPDGRKLPLERIQQRVHQIVAHEGPRAVRYLRGKAGLPGRGGHGLDRQRGKEGCRAAGDNGLVLRLMSGVVGYPRIAHIDRAALRRDGGASVRLAQADHGVRFFFAQGIEQRRSRKSEHRGNGDLDKFRSFAGLYQFQRFLRSVHSLAAEGLKGAEQDLHI